MRSGKKNTSQYLQRKKVFLKETILLSGTKIVKNSNMEGTGLDWSRINLKEKLRGLSNKEKYERMELIKIVVENSKKILEMQIKINKLKKIKEEREREKIEECNKRENEQKERENRRIEEEEKKKRVKKEWKRIKKKRIKKERKAEKE